MLLKDGDSARIYQALQTDLEGAKDVQRAFFPPSTLSIHPYPVKPFTSLLTASEAITTTSCPCQGSAGALLSEMCLGKELARR